MELGALRTFVTVAELANFTRAAERLGMPKARVSTTVQQLEAELGTRLLHRTTRTVRLTPDGEQFRERALSLLADAGTNCRRCSSRRPVRCAAGCGSICPSGWRARR